jgi:hypothetical protein
LDPSLYTYFTEGSEEASGFERGLARAIMDAGTWAVSVSLLRASDERLCALMVERCVAESVERLHQSYFSMHFEPGPQGLANHVFFEQDAPVGWSETVELGASVILTPKLRQEGIRGARLTWDLELYFFNPLSSRDGEGSRSDWSEIGYDEYHGLDIHEVLQTMTKLHWR